MSNSGIIVLVLIAFIYINSEECIEFFTMKTVSSNVDGNSYSVVSKYDDSEKAADMIAEINLFTVDFINKLNKEYLQTSPPSPITKEYLKGRQITETLLNRFNTSHTIENEPTSPEKTSFTRNKGDQIALCLREKQSGKNKFHSMQILKYVMLHEISHIITPELNHSKLFWENFKFILNFGEKHNLYISKNYKLNNELYCGMVVKYNPLYDLK